MAETKLKPTPGFRQPKFPVYESLFHLNQAFETILLHMERLDDYAAFRSIDLLRQFHATAEELRAGINHSVIAALDQRETFDWGHYGRRKAQLEKRFKS